MGRVLKVLLAAVVGVVVLIAGLLGAFVLLLAGLVGLARRPKIHVRTAGGPPRPASSPHGQGDVIDVEATRVESRRELP